MSVAQKEADEKYPVVQSDFEQTNPYDYMMPAITVCQNEAYVNGRTAEPSCEQIHAVAEYLASRVTEPPVFDDYKPFVPLAKKILEIARNAVI